MIRSGIEAAIALGMVGLISGATHEKTVPKLIGPFPSDFGLS